MIPAVVMDMEERVMLNCFEDYDFFCEYGIYFFDLSRKEFNMVSEQLYAMWVNWAEL